MPLEELDLESHLKFIYPKAPMNPGGILYGYYGIKFDSDCMGGKEVHFLYKGII